MTTDQAVTRTSLPDWSRCAKPVVITAACSNETSHITQVVIVVVLVVVVAVVGVVDVPVVVAVINSSTTKQYT